MALTAHEVACYRDCYCDCYCYRDCYCYCDCYCYYLLEAGAGSAGLAAR